jgi:co-chaperonin GroES (HSP10)
MFDPIKVKALRPLKDHVLVREMHFGERFSEAGIFIPDDDKKSQGIRPRWALVYATGPTQKDVKVGQWICIAHGRWTRGIKVEIAGEEFTIRRVDNDEILLVSDERPSDDTLGELDDGR